MYPEVAVRILYIASAYPRFPGDVITPWLVETIRRLGEAGVTVEVLAPAYRANGATDLDGVRIHRFRYAPAAWERLTHEETAPDRVRRRPWYLSLVPSYVIAGCRAAAEVARRASFDAVHVFWPVPHALLGRAARRAAGLPLVLTFFGVELTWTQRQLPWLRPWLRRWVRDAQAVTAISTYTARLLRRLVPGAEPAIVPFGAAYEGPLAPVSRARSADAPYRVLFVGRLVERKGVDRLIEAAARWPADVVVDVVGDGPERARLEALAQVRGVGHRVRFWGVVPDEELRRRYAEADVFVLPAVVDSKGDTEGLGVVLLEALAAGVPVVASAAGGIVDIVEHESTGLLVPPGDVDALVAAVERVRAHPQAAAQWVAQGQQRVRERFAWPAIVNRLVTLYTSLPRR